MRTFGSFTFALLLSLLLSQTVAQQLAVYFRAREEFIAVMAILIILAFVSIAIFAIVFAVSGKPVSLDRAAFAIAGIATLCVLAMLLFGAATSGWTLPGAADMQACTELLVPAWIVVAVQWWIVRHRAVAKMASPSAPA
ncbi:MAG TPA: hypothetical protein VGC86_13480 [Afipia sp.]